MDTGRRAGTRLLTGVGLALLASTSIVATDAQSKAASSVGKASAADDYRAAVKTYCVGCHNQRLRTAGLSLDGLDILKVDSAPEVWEKVLQKLRTRTMPPSGSRRPDDASYERLTSWLEGSLDRHAAAHPNPGRPELSRLNRAEYRRAIRDLLALDVDVAALLPADDSAHGFDNVADILSVSPVLLESYMTAARKISRLAIGSPQIRAVSETYRTAGDLSQRDHFDGLPPGTRGGLLVRHHFPIDGQYEIRIQLARNANAAVRGVDEEHQIDLTLDGARLELFSVGGAGFNKPLTANDQSGGQGLTRAFTADQHLRRRVAIKAGEQSVAAAFVAKPSAYAEGAARGGPAIDRIVISGPYDPVPSASGAPSSEPRQRIFVCQPQRPDEELPCAEAILSRLSRLAYRRPVTATDVQELLRFFRDGRRQGSFDAGIELALRRILASPQFIFRFEDEPENLQPGSVYRLDDLSLASRLSFFLWSSIPDDELLKVAERGRLSHPTVLGQQVERMLADPRAEALMSNFAGQWLLIRNLATLKPNPAEFPEFDDNLRQALRRETELFFESIVREDRSVLDLLNADYTFVNERLARHYGMAGVYGDRFRRIAVTDDNRRGLLGQGSILAVTSYATRTSPVLRGKWILENLLGAPPPPPPPNVPELGDDSEGKVLSMRERMAQHRSSPSCASCHSKMDPLGLALERFDAVGRWREKGEAGEAIDTTGILPDGMAFDGPAQMREALLKRPHVFVTAVTEKLLTYALGRGLVSADAPAVRAIVREAAGREYRFSSLIRGVVESLPFQKKRLPLGPARSAATGAGNE